MTTPSRNLQEILEYRGVTDAVAAEVLYDDDVNGYVTGPVFSLAGINKVTRSTSSSNEAHYYNNMPAVVVSGTGPDELTAGLSAIPFDVFAYITGQNYDETTGALIEGPRVLRYFAFGYKTKKNNGDEVYVWRLKGTFGIPDTQNDTEDDGTDANGQEITYTGINTTHKFANNPHPKTGEARGAKAVNVDVAKGLCDVSHFFDAVTDPDTLAQPAPVPTYKLTIVQAADTTIVVKKGDTALSDGDTITRGDVLTVTVTGGTVEVNGQPFTSGRAYKVLSSVVVVSTAEE